MWWEVKIFLSHGSNLSGGVAILFAKKLNMINISSYEIVKGRILVVQAELMGFPFLFINIYSPNNGVERVDFFFKLSSELKKNDDNVCMVLGGDWNCTLDFTLDRNSEEPYPQSAKLLSSIIRKYDLFDVWRAKHPTVKQYTWVKASHDHISAARLDRFYISKNNSNRVLKANIFPNGFTDHHLCMIEISLKKSQHCSYYWHFNLKLLHDSVFCEKFGLFWSKWQEQKSDYEDLVQWWDVGKAQIRFFLSELYSSLK